MMKKTKRLFAMLLMLCMLVSMIPGSVFASNGNMPFTDVKESNWFYEPVQYVYNKKMMNGTGTTVFSPDDTTTRGMIVTILYRMEGMPGVTGESFSDVAKGRYYTDAVSWASKKGIVNGYGNSKFGPDDNITRQQMATILYRYAKYKGYGTNVVGDLTKYNDYGQVSTFAVQAMNWAVGSGLVQGVGNNKLDPGGNANRAQIAMILMRFCKNIVDASDIDYSKVYAGTLADIKASYGGGVDHQYSGKKYTLIDLTGDGILELVVSLQNNKFWFDLIVYSYDGKKVSCIGVIGFNSVPMDVILAYGKGFIYESYYKGDYYLEYYKWNGVNFQKEEIYSRYYENWRDEEVDVASWEEFFDASKVVKSLGMVEF